MTKIDSGRKNNDDKIVNSAIWINAQIKENKMDKKELLAGTDFNIRTLDNFLNNHTALSKNKVLKLIQLVDEKKVKPLGLRNCNRYHHLPTKRFIEFLRDYLDNHNYLCKDSDLALLLDISQSKVSKIINGVVSTSTDEQIKIIEYFDSLRPDQEDTVWFNPADPEYFEPEETETNNQQDTEVSELDIIANESLLYIIIDQAMREYRDLLSFEEGVPNEKVQFNTQQQLEDIMFSYLKIIANNYSFTLESLISDFTDIYKRKEKNKRKEKSPILSDTIKIYNGSARIDTNNMDQEKRAYLRKEIESKLNGPDKEKYTIFRCAFCAVAKSQSQLSLNETVTIAAIISLIDDPSLLKSSKDKRFYEVIDRFCYAALSNTNKISNIYNTSSDLNSYFESLSDNTNIMTESQIGYYRYDLESELESTPEDLLLWEEFKAEAREIMEANKEGLLLFNSLAGRDKRIVIDNLPCFVPLPEDPDIFTCSSLHFDQLIAVLDECKSLNKEQLEKIIKRMDSYPSVEPRFYSQTNITHTDCILSFVKDPFAEITYCRKMMIIVNDPKMTGKNVTIQKNVEKKYQQFFEHVITWYTNNSRGVCFDIANQIERKLKFTQQDWYIWQLILNVYYVSGTDDLYKILSEAQENTE